MANKLKELEKEVANALDLVNAADEAVDQASARVKATMTEAKELQKATYKAERKFKKASEELTEKVKLAYVADEAYRKAMKILAIARSEEK